MGMREGGRVNNSVLKGGQGMHERSGDGGLPPLDKDRQSPRVCLALPNPRASSLLMLASGSHKPPDPKPGRGRSLYIWRGL